MRVNLAAAAMLIAFVLAPLAAAAGTADPAEIAYRERVLPNGLRVITAPDHARAQVAVQLWYAVGSRDDPPGRSGFAHLFEHLMFRGARDMPAEYIDELTESAGGTSNASTADDFTEYHETAPPWLLERLLWAEAQRMGSLVLDQQALDTERQVVEHELGESRLETPDGPEFGCGPPARIDARPTIGALPELRAASLAEVRAFHARYYRPDNAVLVVVGDFAPAELDAWIDRYFGALPRPQAERAGAAGPAPRANSRRTITAYGGDAPDRALVLAYPGPRAGSPDSAALAVLGAIVAMDQAAPAPRHLLSGRASAALSDAQLSQGGGMVCLGGVAARGRSEAQVRAALHKAVERLRAAPLSDGSVETAKLGLLVDAYRDRETIEGVAALLGHAAVADGDVSHLNREVGQLQDVRSADVLRAARRYLQARGCVDIRLRPAAAAKGEPVATRSAPTAPRLRRPGEAAHAPPLPPHVAAPALSLPEVAETRLPNGLRVIAARSGALPLETAILEVRGGAAADPPGAPGLAKLVGRLALFGRLAAGPGDRGPDYDALGLSAAVEAHDASTGLILSGLAGALPKGLALLAGGLGRPTLAGSDVTVARHAVADAGADAQSDLDGLADAGLDAAVLGLAPGAAAQRLDRSALLLRYQQMFRPDRGVLVLAGGVEPHAALAWAEAAFAGWTTPAAAPAAPVPAPAGARARMLLVDTPDAPLAQVVVGARAVGRDDPARAAMDLANAALGGGYTARLSQHIRVDRGLTYDVASAIDERRGAALFSARTATDAAAAPEVARLVLDELATFAAQGPSADELERARAMLIGDLASRTWTADDLADLLAEQAMAGEPPGDLADYPRRLAEAAAPQVQAAARRLASPDGLSLVVVGDARRLARLKRDFPQMQVVPASDLAPP
jgi:zinc protease